MPFFTGTDCTLSSPTLVPGLLARSRALPSEEAYLWPLKKSRRNRLRILKEQKENNVFFFFSFLPTATYLTYITYSTCNTAHMPCQRRTCRRLYVALD